MAIIKVGEIYTKQFGDHDEPNVEVAFGALPVGYSILKAFQNLEPDSKFKLALELTQEQFEEAHAALFAALKDLNAEGNYKLDDDELKDLLKKNLDKSKNNPGMFRFYASKKMSYTDKETKKLLPTHVACYDATTKEELADGVRLGAGSIVRSNFIVSLFKKGKSVLLHIKPKSVHVVEAVDVPRKDNSLSHEGLDGYDY